MLLLGRSGSGKTWAAQRIHERSGRPGRFVALNAAALPQDPTQLRSVLLGHKKGAFTGADRDLEGAWFAAHEGTLFLDEADSLGPAGQAFLLTLLEQTADLSPLGAPPGQAPRPADVRVVTSSKVPLGESGLRQDLAFRLVDGAIVEIPGLDERRDDIPRLVAELCHQLRREDGEAVALSEAAIEVCQRASWPGEIRQLRGLVRTLAREAAFEGQREVTAADVEERLAATARALGGTVRAVLEGPGAQGAVPSVLEPAAGRSVNPRHLERDDVVAALDAEGGNIQRTADRLGIARGTLVAKMDRFGIVRPGRIKE